MNRRKAIRQRCLDCSAHNAADVRECKNSSCPLWPYRMSTEKQNPKHRNIAIRSYCLWCVGGKTSEVSDCPVKNCPLYPFRLSTISRSTPFSISTGHIEATMEPRNKKAYDRSFTDIGVWKMIVYGIILDFYAGESIIKAKPGRAGTQPGF